MSMFTIGQQNPKPFIPYIVGRLTKAIIIINPTYLLRSTKSKYTGTPDKTKTNATADVCGFANKGAITRQQDTTNMTTGIPIHTL